MTPRSRSSLDTRTAAVPARIAAISARITALGARVAPLALAATIVACGTPSPRSPGAPAAGEAPPPTPFSKTIDPLLQPFVEAEVERVVAEWEATSGVILVLDPATGAILASAGREGGATVDVALTRAFVTGSTLKTVTLALALDAGVISLAERFDCENGARRYGELTLRDAGKHGLLTPAEMLVVSTNIGFSKVFDRLGGDKLARGLGSFHFAEPPPLPGAVAGELIVPIEDRSFKGAVVAAGEAMRASPLQMALAYAVFANEGAYVPPTLVHRQGAPPREQVIKKETARAVSAILGRAVNDENATGRHARVTGVRVAGKTGTGEWSLPEGKTGTYTSFIGLVPAERPRFVILVGVENPKSGGSGGTVAAPVFARVAAHALAR